MTPWQIIVANSLLPSGTAYEHVQAQRQNTPVQVYGGVQLTDAAVEDVLDAAGVDLFTDEPVTDVATFEETLTADQTTETWPT